MPENSSDIARFRQQHALQEQAMQYLQSGLAITTRHAFITARAQRGAERIIRLLEAGKEEEAIVLMNHPTWGETSPQSLEEEPQ